MKRNGGLIIFTLLLVIMQTACKYFFAAEADWSGISPFIAIALFSGFIIRKRNMSFLLPLLALFISDAVIQGLYLKGEFAFAGFYAGQWKNYLLLLAVTGLGWWMKGKTYGGILAGGLAGPTFYFLVSNFMVWQATTEAVYPKSFNGLMLCYEAGLPFYGRSLAATVFFLLIIVLSYNLFTRNRTELKLA